MTLSIFLISIVSAEGFTHCCEKTTSGAWCQNAELNECNENFRTTPTSCEATSYCSLGTCIDSQEGTCMENTPEIVCQENEGVWKQGKPEEIPQCQLGCCLVGDQAAFVSQTRCKRLSSLYGLETDFRNNIGSEAECIASATSESKGACVFEKEFERTCLFITQKECSIMSGVETEFHLGFLCSDESLSTNCGPTKETTCVEGKDETYFLDSCGNLANIYDASRLNDKVYWSKIIGKDEACNFGLSNADSTTCGNCDYFLGSTCKEFKREEDRARPNQGDNICRDLSCEFEGREYQHGETWCAKSKGIKNNLPGSRAFRMVCYNGDVTVEPCADFRQETCLEATIGEFRTASCVVNKWQDCFSQSDSQDCLNSDRRDCLWIEDKCFPKFSPGFNFWGSGKSESMCNQANAECIVKYEKKGFLGGEEKCIENCECLENGWEEKMNQQCVAIGDCGGKTNYLGVQGYNKGSSVIRKKLEEEKDDE